MSCAFGWNFEKVFDGMQCYPRSRFGCSPAKAFLVGLYFVVETYIVHRNAC